MRLGLSARHGSHAGKSPRGIAADAFRLRSASACSDGGRRPKPGPSLRTRESDTQVGLPSRDSIPAPRSRQSRRSRSVRQCGCGRFDLRFGVNCPPIRSDRSPRTNENASRSSLELLLFRVSGTTHPRPTQEFLETFPAKQSSTLLKRLGHEKATHSSRRCWVAEGSETGSDSDGVSWDSAALAAAGLASADDRRRSTPTHREAGT